MDAFDFPINEDYLKNIFDNDTPAWSSYFELFSKNYWIQILRTII